MLLAVRRTERMYQIRMIKPRFEREVRSVTDHRSKLKTCRIAENKLHVVQQEPIAQTTLNPEDKEVVTLIYRPIFITERAE